MTRAPTRSRPSRAELAAVEPLVRAKYDALYGPARWDSQHADFTINVVAFVIDCARTGATRCIVHTDRHGNEHTLPPETVLAALEAVVQPIHEGV